MGARVERFEGLIAEAVRRAASEAHEPVLGAAAREQVLAAIGAQSSLGLAGGAVWLRGSPARSRSAGRRAELQVRPGDAGELTEALRAGWAAVDETGASGEELGLAVRGVAGWHGSRALERCGRDRRREQRRGTAALDELRRRPALWRGTPVLFYGFDDLTRLQIDTIETLGGVVGARVMVSLTYEPGRTAFAGRAATFAALAPLAGEHTRAAGAGRVLRAALARGAAAISSARCSSRTRRGTHPGGAVRLLEGGGERAELELVAAEIGGLLGEGVAPEEIAVVHRSPGAIAALIEEVFSDRRAYRTRVEQTPALLEHGRRPSADRLLAPAGRSWARCGGQGSRGGAARRRGGICFGGCGRPVCWSGASWPTGSRPGRAARGSRAPPRHARCGRRVTGGWMRSTAGAGGAGRARWR